MTSVLVLGGARSGKSRYAEALLAQAPAVRYVATGAVPGQADDDAEWAARVAEHRRRRPAHWCTVETMDVPGVLTDPVGQGSLLVDCLGTWLTRLIDEANAWEDPARAQEVQERAGSALVAALQNTDVEVVFVSNEVGSGVVPATASGRLFRDLLGRLNAQVAAACDRAVLIVAGRVIELPAPPRPRVGAPAQDVPHRPGVTRDGWRLAFGTLTAWPSPAPVSVNRRVAGVAMMVAPLVMLPLVALLAGPALLTAHGHAPPLVAAGLLVAAVVLSTRGMHLDGLADTCDGLSAGYDRERALAVMRTGDVGPSGAGAIALVLLIQAAATADLLSRSPSHLVLAALAVLASRHVLAWGCRRGVPPARPEGLGAAMAGSVGLAPVIGTAGVLTAAGAVAAWAAGLPWWSSPVVVAAAIAGSWALFARAVRRLGGITGDVLGAAVEIALTVALAAATLVP